MIRRTTAAIAMVATLLFTAGAPASAATVEDFDGLWAGTDIDGSFQLLLVSGSLDLILFDTDATVACATGGPLLAWGSGSLSHDRVDVTYNVRCFDGTPVAPIPFGYTLLADGTLEDDAGAIWNNVFG